MIDIQRLKVLIVDDQASMRAIIFRTLKQFGVNALDQAEGVESAKEKLKQAPFDLVLCDFNMDDGNGTDLLRFCRTHPVLKNIKFILVTGNGEQDVVHEAIKLRVNNYLRKPVAPNELLLRIKKTFSA